MPPLNKAKCAAMQCVRNKSGKFTLRADKKIFEEMPHEFEGSDGNSEGEILNEPKDDNEKEILNKPEGEGNGEEMLEKMLDIFGDDEDLWDDEEDSSWESESNIEIEEEIKNQLLEIGLSWKQNTYLEKKIRDPYLTKKIPKSTYYDKYGPSGI